jgi:CheY-like chemotaxis protein
MNKLILLAEDVADEAFFFQQTLKKAGITNPLFVLSDGDEVIAYLNGDGPFTDRQKFPIPEILFLDLKMTKVSGFEVLEWIKTQPQLQGLIVVAVSGYLSINSEASRVYGLGAYSCLSKPCQPEDILNLMQSLSENQKRV